MLLNKTTGVQARPAAEAVRGCWCPPPPAPPTHPLACLPFFLQVRKVIWELFELCPTPAAATAADVQRIEALIKARRLACLLRWLRRARALAPPQPARQL